jgi:hypothetical protein
MPRRYTLAELRTRCKRRADKENDPHISDAEWNALISEQYGELWELVAGTGLRYFETRHSIVADGSDSYDEPDDHGKTVGLDRIEPDGTRFTLLPLMAQERVRFSGREGPAVEYAIIDDQIVLYPKPAHGEYELIYIPQPTDLSTYADDEAVDVVCIHGEAFLIWGAAVKAMSKGEADVRLALGERDRCAQRLLEWAAERDANEPRRRVLDPRTGLEGPYDPSSWWSR